MKKGQNESVMSQFYENFFCHFFILADSYVIKWIDIDVSHT